MTRPGTRQRLGEVDALRGIAAVLVVLFHYTVQAPRILDRIEAVPLNLSWGAYGVQMFFAISGFVIFMTLERTRSSADFAVARFARLYPAYWAGICLTTILVHALGVGSLGQSSSVIAINLTMLQGFLYVPAVDGAYWSLTVELAFYVCMWALWRARLLDRIETILTGWIALRLLWWAVPAMSSLLGNLLLVKYIAFFAIGIAAFRVWKGERTWRHQAAPLLAGLAVTAFVDGAAMATVYVATLGLFFALVSGWLAFLDRPFLLWLGALSYPLYLVHQNIGYGVISTSEAMGAPPWLATGMAIVIALGIAQIVRECVEQPALKTIRSLWKARREVQAA